MSPSSRRFLAGLIRLGLVVLAIVLVSGYVMRRTSRHTRHIRVDRTVDTVDSLAPGDLRIYNADSSVDLILRGDAIYAGLSPQTVAKIKTKLEAKTAKDTSGFGGSIAQIVKSSVAGAIGTHAAFPLSDIRDVRYDSGRLVFEWTDGGTHDVFGNSTVNDEKVSNTFRREDADRFIQAFRARKHEE